jgi:hypothetical protein
VVQVIPARGRLSRPPRHVLAPIAVQTVAVAVNQVYAHVMLAVVTAAKRGQLPARLVAVQIKAERLQLNLSAAKTAPVTAVRKLSRPKIRSSSPIGKLLT